MKGGLEGKLQEIITFNREIYFSCELESSFPHIRTLGWSVRLYLSAVIKISFMTKSMA